MNYLEKVLQKIRKELPNAEIFLFGSRANNTYKVNSDYDIGIINGKQKIPLSIMANIKMYVDELPIRVDVVDFNAVDDKFKQLVFDQKILKL